MLNNNSTQNGQRKTLRCAIYTRKSHEEGLDQEFNSLDAQREAAEAYIESQKLQGWKAIPYRYDDGGFSGGTMERPALQRLLADIDANKIDVIVVYKIDRLSRSLLDFMKMIERFNEKEVSFVSVTQHFSTTDSTGRMMLNILMTFAQYEREVIGERIRDKVAAAKRRGVTSHEKKDQTNHQTFRQWESTYPYPHVDPKNAWPQNGIHARNAGR